MIYGPLLLMAIVLFELFRLLKMGDNAKAIISASQQAMRVLASADLADEEKESFMRRGSLALFKATLGLAAKLILAGAILFGLFELIAALFPDLRRPLLESFVSPAAVGIVTFAVIVYAWARAALRRRGNR